LPKIQLETTQKTKRRFQYWKRRFVAM